MIKSKEISKKLTSTELAHLTVEAIQDKKGQKIVQLDLREIEEAVADYFIICQGSSTTQVTALAENVEKYLEEHAGEKPIGKSGLRVGEWALVDYFNVVVHIFVEPVRQEFALEDLWGDAKITHYEDLN